MTTRFDKSRDNLLAGLDACKVSRLLTDSEIAQLTEVIEDKLSELEETHPREETI
jgi:hypothetical protein